MRTRFLTAAAVAVIATASLAGCTAATSTAGSGSAAGFGSAGGSQSIPRAAAGEPASDAKAAAIDRSVVTTGTLHLVAHSPVQAAEDIQDLVEAAAGSVARSTENPTGRPSADLVLRIPAAVFPRTLTAIEHEGHVRDVSVNATDVTAQVTDYAVRTANLRVSIARLQQLLSRATSNADLVQIESSLTDRQGSLEQLLAQQRALANQVTFATLTVSIVPPTAAPKQGPADFLTGLVAGTQGLIHTLAVLAVALGVVLPWAAVIGAAGTLVALLVRAVRRRTRPTSA